MTTPPCDSCRATDCEAAFHRCLAADFSDPSYGAVHHLVVPTYGLQHGWYPDEFATEVVAFVRDHLDRHPSDHDRRLVRAATDGSTQVRLRGHRSSDLAWDRTVLDVDHGTASSYVASVRAWAASVVAVIGGAEDRRLGSS